LARCRRTATSVFTASIGGIAEAANALRDGRSDGERDGVSSRGSVRPIVGDTNDPTPFFDFLRDKYAEFVWRAAKYRTAEFSKPLFRLRIREHSVDLCVELRDDRRRGARGRTDPVPNACLRDLSDKMPYFVFSMPNPTPSPEGTSGTAVFMSVWRTRLAARSSRMVAKAFELKVEVQVGETDMVVDWVQLARWHAPTYGAWRP